jgi:hypothetical protein
MFKIKPHLETASTIAVMIAALVVSGVFLLSYLKPKTKPMPTLKAGFEKGQRLPPIPGISYGDAPKTLVIALNTNCRFCSESVPFYNRLAEAQRSNKTPVRILTVFPNSEHEVQQYTQEHQFALTSKSAVSLQSLNIDATPTMILLDRNGTIVDFWVGKLSESAEEQVVKLFTS